LSVRSRRGLRLACAVALATASVGAPRAGAAQSPAGPLESEFIFELLLDVDPQLDAGHVRIAPITGGTFAGPNIRGTVHAGGADWITQASGHSSLDVRITLETDDGAIVFMTYTGVVARGDGGVYWRVRPVFSTASEKYDWLNHIVAVGKNKQVQGKVAYDVFRIL
jgi:hypothetical protein